MEAGPRALRGAFRLCTVSGVDLRVHWSWAIIAVLLTASVGLAGLPVLAPAWVPGLRWVVAGVVALLFFASLLAHEMAHALMARRRGLQVHGITLFLFGGVSLLGGQPRRPTDELLIAVVGPLTSFGLMFAFGALYLAAAALAADVLAVTFFYVALVNLIVGTFNLLPAFPLDGGRILRALLWGLSRNLSIASLAAAWMGRLFAALFAGLGVWLLVAGAATGAWLLLLGIFLWVAASPRTAVAS